ncbi:hypothetical protein NBRC116601_00410 [Cognatishimia sp. WU-CL00825]|uniref:helix-turn-helix domain-containing protein n=1 Tax=Cognatishimia sp. WU-CL00825 TaxID=3127658 RepID=UPI003106E8E9
MPKAAKISGIKSVYSYTIEEAAGITGVSDRTVRSWIKQRLPAMQGERPILVRRDALLAFIKAQRKTRKAKIAQDGFYCLKCRTERKPEGGFVICEIRNNRAKLTSICEVRETIMNKPVSIAQVPFLHKVFDLTVQNGTETTESSTAD